MCGGRIGEGYRAATRRASCPAAAGHVDRMPHTRLAPLLVQLAVQDTVGTPLVAFHDPRKPNVVLAPTPRLPL